MPNYNFYDAFSWIDFERFSRDIIQKREDIPFELTKIGKDKGIDFKHKTDNIFIVGQAKKRKYYKDFIRDLKHGELKKVKRLKPDRYIITTTLSLSNSQVDEVFKIFDGYIISKQDILGKDELNELLDQKEYHEIERKHTKLWISSSNVLQNILDETINRRQKNLVLHEIDKIKSVSKVYVQNLSFDEAQSILEQQNYVIISGTAGSGKTTLARMLILYFLNQDYELIKVTENISQAEHVLLPNKKQIIFFDDFLGSFQFDDKEIGDRDLVSLNRFIDIVKNSQNKLFILTTREYILRRGQIKYKEQLNNEVIELKKCIVDASKYTRYEKAEILFNHLYHSELDLNQIVFLKDKKYYDNIISHSNYSPRLIEDAFKKFNFGADSRFDGAFYVAFKSYLDDPFSYWEALFKKQSVASQILLLNLFISCEPLDVDLLKFSFDNTCNAYKKQFDDLKITPNTFRIILKELSDTFINIEEGGFDKLVSFQNPSVNDFLLKYLRERQDWISILIESATFWNQLIFVFTTDYKYDSSNKYINRFGETIDEIDDERYVSGERILLSSNNSRVLSRKIIKDFNRLKFSNIEKKEFTDEYTFHNSLETIEISKLIHITAFFDININVELREFIINKVDYVFNHFKNGNTNKLILDSGAMQNFPSLIRKIKNFIAETPEDVTKMFRSSITYSLEYYGLSSLREVYNVECKEYFEKELRSIKTDIRNQIISDLEWRYADDNYEAEEIQEIIDHAKLIFEEFGMRMTSKFENEMEFAAFEGLPRKEYAPWQGYDRKQEREEEKKWKQELKKRKKEEKEIERLFNQVNNRKPINGLIEFKKKRKESDKQYFERVLDSIIDDKKLLAKLETLAFQTIKNIKNIFSNDYLKKNLDNFNNDDELINLLESINPIIIENNNKYSFGNNELRNYLGVSHIVKMDKQEIKDFIENDYLDLYFEDPDFHEDYWKIWNEMNSNIFVKDFIQVYWKKFKDNMDFSTKINLFKSIIKYAQQEISVGINDESNDMEYLGGSFRGGNILWRIFEYYSQYDIFDISSWYFDSYHYEDDENLPSFFTLNKEYYPELKRYILENFESSEYHFMNRDLKEYNINMHSLVHNKYALDLFLKIGMVDTIFNLMNELDSFFDGLTS
ncbi:hypothetical protein BFR04_09200 [Gaetbulibacter sp. 4G1]|nr:hypothetical protein [Gaetbulibacter sp. 4G1]PIA77606.1 hypothetical protein BFR04_09200 [Gaetbulibacter sp. 4G1]